MEDLLITDKPTYKELERELTNRKRFEEALRDSEEFTLNLLNNSPHPILVINKDTSIRYVNPALETLTDFSSEELLGMKTPYPWWTEETMQKTAEDLEKAMSNGAQKLEELFQKKNGEQFWVEITSVPIRKNEAFKY
ncbi:MAG: PAS domain S-box protein [Desulfobacterales bacterium]